MADFLQALRLGRVLLMDGAMGTELQRAGLVEGECPELWNLIHPEQVAAIHQAYVKSGAEMLVTNTFQANPGSFARCGIRDRLSMVQKSAIRLAREAAGSERFVLFDIGPFSREAAQEAAAGALEAALAEQPDALLIETCSDLAAVVPVLECRQHLGSSASSLPVLLSWTFRSGRDGSLSTICGDTPTNCAAKSRNLELAALGANCGRDIGMEEMIQILRQFRQQTDLPLFARPNAGSPERRGDRWVHPRSPAEMASRVSELVEAGTVMVGGCCGTTPDHIAAFRIALSGLR